MPTLHHTGLTVSDLERSLHFWRDAMGMEELFQQEKEGGYLEAIVREPGAHVRMAHLAFGGVPPGPVDHGEDLGASHPDRQQRDQRGPGRRGTEIEWVESGHAGGRSKSSTTWPSGSRR